MEGNVWKMMGNLNLNMWILVKWVSQVVLVIKNLPANAGDKRPGFSPWVREGTLENLATHSSIVAWRIQWAEEPGELQSMGVTKSQT